MEGNKDLVDALARFDHGRGLSSFIQKNQFVLCRKTLSPNLVLGLFKADEGIIAEALHPPATYDKNLNVYRHIAKVGTPKKYIEALEETGNERMLEIIREILDKSGLLGAGGATGEISGGTGRTGNESHGASSGSSNAQNQPLPSPSSSSSLPLSSSSSGPSNDDEKELPEKPESYECENVRVLFINQKFDSPGKLKNAEYTQQKREGADADREHVENLFKKTLKMEVQVEENKDSDEIPWILEGFQRKCKKDGNDGCIVIISTHGADPHSLLMDDLKSINLEKDVIQQFGRDEFPYFDGKPKIFLVNACRIEGTEMFPGQDSPQVSLRYADVLIGHSTVPCHTSWRDPEVGSWYIKTLHDVYMENKDKKLEIRKLLGMVGRKVAETLECGDDFQIPEYRNQLFDKNFYLTKNQK